MSPRRKSSAALDDAPMLDFTPRDHGATTPASASAPFDPAAVSLEPGISLVEASAGTGKTYSITQLVLRLLLARRPDGDHRVRGIGSILVVTFTNAATDELITRVRAVLREATDVFRGGIEPTTENAWLFALREELGAAALPRLHEALASLDQLAIFTIHGFCKRVLEESALESGTPFGARFIDDDNLVLERIAQDWWRRTMYEDADLATLAVHLGWAHDAFLEDLKTWRRLPGTRMDPDVGLAEARDALASAIRQFGAAWSAARARDFLGERKWYASSPLAKAEGRERTVAAGERLAAGDLSAAMLIASACSSAAMLHPKNGMQKSCAAPLRDAVAPEPFVQATDLLVTALDRMEKALRVSCLLEVQSAFVEEKRRRHMLGFDDLLRHLHDAVVAGGTDGLLARAIRDRYDAALIDEFQDTDPFQFPIFSTAFAGRPLFLIGDPKQAIYSFRGADLFAYMAAAARAERRYTLARNWRSSARMVRAVNGLFTHRPNAFLYDSIAFTEATAARAPRDPLAADGMGALHWWLMPPDAAAQLTRGEATRRTEGATVREIVRLLSHAEGRAALRPGQIAVLVRAGFEGVAMQRALREVNVPSIVSGMEDILRSRELTDLETVLHAVLASGDARAVRGALATELWGATADEIHRLALPAHEAEWQLIVERLLEWRERWARFGFMRMVQGMLTHLQATERLLAQVDGERRVTNLRHAVELFHTAAADERLSPEGLLLWIANVRATGEASADRTELRLESDADAVQIVTVHKSKGLEYDVVFCPTLWATRRTRASEPVLVHEDGAVVFDHGSPTRATRGRLAASEELAEELRLVYVALTRARVRCYVAWGAVHNKSTGIHAGHTALGYLLREDAGAGTPDALVASVPDSFVASLDRFLEPISALVAGSGGAMTMECLAADVPAVAPWRAESATAFVPACRTDLPAAQSLRSWRVASFTSLTAGRHTDQARDVLDEEMGEPRSVSRAAPDDFLAFPSGRLPGVALHELFELVDFGASAGEIRPLVADVLERARLHEPEARIGAVTTMAARVLAAPLPGAGFSLRDLPRARTLREWAFHLPLGMVDGALLSKLFAAHGDALARRYAPSLRQLSGDRVFGFLTGVVDLAFEHDGRWYLADWKSNHLGHEPSCYEEPALERAMFASHYVLQYHLYLVALHRFLRARVAGYGYDTHIGGAWYAFLRGIDGGTRGWFHDRPPRALIEALDAVMDAGTGMERAS